MATLGIYDDSSLRKVIESGCFDGIERIDVDHTQITDLTPLSRLGNLKWLDVSYTGVTDLNPLLGLTRLQVLVIYGIKITKLLLIDKLASNGVKIYR